MTSDIRQETLNTFDETASPGSSGRWILAILTILSLSTLLFA